MKVKKFKNLWAMGLILFGVILVALYTIKIFFPKFIVGIAEIPSIVSFGNYVNNHKWAYYLFAFITSFVMGYFYCCACCRVKKLTLFGTIIVAIEVILLLIAQRFIPLYYLEINIMCMLIMPTLIIFIDKKEEKSIKYLYSTIITFCVHSIAQILSLNIRGISVMITQPNIATVTILLIDLYVWLWLLYNYFNYKKENKNGIT